VKVGIIVGKIIDCCQAREAARNTEMTAFEKEL